jgi:metal-sulfur cluster biosynthetic enzyme
MTADVPMPEAREIVAALRTVIDPELEVNIVDLGLIYDIRITDGSVHVTFTLTTPGCPLQYALANGIRRSVLSVPGVRESEVKLVWDPPWDPSMISEEGRKQLS